MASTSIKNTETFRISLSSILKPAFRLRSAAFDESFGGQVEWVGADPAS